MKLSCVFPVKDLLDIYFMKYISGKEKPVVILQWCASGASKNVKVKS